MTLCKGDHLVIKRNGKIVEGEAYHEFEVMECSPSYYDGAEVRQMVLLKKVE
jgi:hypothetical protein